MTVRHTLRRNAAGWAFLAGLLALTLFLLGAGLATWNLP